MLVEGPLDAIALTPAQVAALDSDPAGRDAALRAFDLLGVGGTWPTAAALPDGHDPASLARESGPGALRAALEAAGPLADLVVDERLAAWSGRLHWVEGCAGAMREAAQLLATFPAEQVGRRSPGSPTGSGSSTPRSPERRRRGQAGRGRCQ